MLSRVAFVLGLVACAGGSTPRPAQPAPTSELPQVGASVRGESLSSQPPQAEPAPVDTPAPAPAPTPSIYERIRDTDGPIAGMPGFAIRRKADKKYCGGIAIGTTRGKKVAKDDEPLAAVFEIEFPKNLDFDPAPKNEKKLRESTQRFKAFLGEIKKLGDAAHDHYNAMLGRDAESATKVIGAARMAQVDTRITSILARSEIPKDVRTGEFADEKIKAYCDAVQVAAEPLQGRAEASIGICAEQAKLVGQGWWNEVCAAPRAP